MAAESVISPGVFMQENDQSLITQGPIEVGAAIIGPTVIGPVNNPTVVTSYSDYKSKFGGAFISGGSSYEYLTSIAALNYFEQGGDSLVVVRVASGAYTPATASIPSISFGNTIASFELETLSVGEIMNNSEAGALIQGGLTSGSSANVRWEIANVDTSSGIFSLNIRSGDDVNNNRSVLETWTALSLDPNQSNFISYVIGDQKMNPQLEMGGACAGNYYMQWSGSYANKSRYVRVKSVNLATPNFFNNIGQPASATYQGSLPQLGSGSLNGGFNGAEGAMFGGAQAGGVANYPLNMFEAISVIPSSHTLTGNTQGLAGTDYDLAINLLQNKDAYDFNVIYAPGINSQNAPDQINSILYLSQERGDCIAVVDMTGYGQSVGTVNNLASQYDNSYAATYWPWLQVRSKETGRLNFVPASTLVPAVYEYNDKVSAEWFAPAGLNRGNISVALQPERRLSQCDRDALYNGKINPIASFSGVGTVIYGQKTLQSRATALDRVNVRRLLIALKAYIGQIGEQLVFEPNTQVTRNKFLNQVNPYLEYVQQRQGLYAFQVVMDETNNTPDVIDRNQLVGSIYLQPTRTAEFITLDFNILPTGATFG